MKITFLSKTCSLNYSERERSSAFSEWVQLLSSSSRGWKRKLEGSFPGNFMAVDTAVDDLITRQKPQLTKPIPAWKRINFLLLGQVSLIFENSVPSKLSRTLAKKPEIEKLWLQHWIVAVIPAFNSIALFFVFFMAEKAELRVWFDKPTVLCSRNSS